MRSSAASAGRPERRRGAAAASTLADQVVAGDQAAGGGGRQAGFARWRSMSPPRGDAGVGVVVNIRALRSRRETSAEHRAQALARATMPSAGEEVEPGRAVTRALASTSKPRGEAATRATISASRPTVDPKLEQPVRIDLALQQAHPAASSRRSGATARADAGPGPDGADRLEKFNGRARWPSVPSSSEDHSSARPRS